MKSILSGLGLLVGVIIGAGMFALPYVTAQAGILWSFIHMVIAFFIVTAIHLLYGEVIYATRGKHRLPGYVGMYLGGEIRRLAICTTFFEYYGALLIYGLLGGAFLHGILGTWSLGPDGLTLLFFFMGAAFLALNIERVGMANFVLSLILLICVTALILWAAPQVRVSQIPFANSAFWFLPFGVFLFAFGGASAIPDVADIFRKKHNRTFRRVVVWGTIISLIVYAVFIIAVVGVSGANTSSEAIMGLEAFLGRKAVVLGSIIGFLAVITSFISLGLDLRYIFEYDYGWKRKSAWVGVMLVPVALFMFGFSNVITIIGLVGSVAVGIDGILILLMVLKLKKQL